MAARLHLLQERARKASALPSKARPCTGAIIKLLLLKRTGSRGRIRERIGRRRRRGQFHSTESLRRSETLFLLLEKLTIQGHRPNRQRVNHNGRGLDSKGTLRCDVTSCPHHERLIDRQSLRAGEEEDLIRDLRAPIDSKANPWHAATTQLHHEKLTAFLRGKKVRGGGQRHEMRASLTQRWERATGYLPELPLAEPHWPWRRTSHPHPVVGVNTSIGTLRPRDGTDGVSAPCRLMIFRGCAILFNQYMPFFALVLFFGF